MNYLVPPVYNRFFAAQAQAQLIATEQLNRTAMLARMYDPAALPLPATGMYPPFAAVPAAMPPALAPAMNPLLMAPAMNPLLMAPDPYAVAPPMYMSPYGAYL